MDSRAAPQVREAREVDRRGSLDPILDAPVAKEEMVDTAASEGADAAATPLVSPTQAHRPLRQAC